jgi:hypothetical protein
MIATVLSRRGERWAWSILHDSFVEEYVYFVLTVASGGILGTVS